MAKSKSKPKSKPKRPRKARDDDEPTYAYDSSPEELEASRVKAYRVAQLDAERGYLEFLDHVIVDAQPNKRPFREIAETWQWERALRSRDAIEHLAGLPHASTYNGPLSFWNGYHKGSDKTHDTAREICYILGWSRKRVNIVVCAGDQDQARLITTAMIGIVRDNQWMKDYVHVTALTADGKSGSRLEVIPMDAWTGQGIFPDMLVVEEVTHWKHQAGRDFWNFILSTVNKRPHCVLKVNTNAGLKATWQWDERNRISKSKFWSFYEAPVGKPLPTWMNQEKIDDDSKGMVPGEKDRLYKNRWVDPGEENGYLTYDDCVLCRSLQLTERITGERSNEYILIVDYGGVFDRCALCVMHAVRGRDVAIVDRLDCWQGTHEERIEINKREEDPDAQSVQGWIDIMLMNFRVTKMVFDPTQLEGLAIFYEHKNKLVERFKYRIGQGNHRMAQMLKTSVHNRKIMWSPYAGFLPGAEDDELEKELSSLIVKPMSYGYRFDHETGRHDDRATVLGMGLIYTLPEVLPQGQTGPTAVKTDAQMTMGRQSPMPHKDWAAQRNIFGLGNQPQNGHRR